MKFIQVGMVTVCAALLAGCGANMEQIDADIEAKISKRMTAVDSYTGSLKTRIQDLEASNAELKAEIAKLKLLPGGEATAEGSAEEGVAEVAEVPVNPEIKQLVTEWIQQPSGGQLAMSQVFSQQFQSQMQAYEEKKQEEEEARREQQRQEWEQRRAEAEEQRFAQLSEDLGLNQNQAEQLKLAETTLQESIRESFAAMRESGDFDRDKMRETIDSLRDAHKQITGQILNQEQMATYEEQQPRMPFGGGRGGPWGGGGRGR